MERDSGAGQQEQPTQLVTALAEMRDALAPVRLPLPLPDSEHHRRRAQTTTDQLDDYVLPRLATLDAPLLAVVGGSTGAGKSTLVSSLVGRVVSAPGVIRPTTRAPVLVHHPDDAEWFVGMRILPGLARSTGATTQPGSLQLVAEPRLPSGLALLDAPDIDSVVEENRLLAAQLLAAADLWLFATSAARYADAVPWDYLHAAARRSAAVAVVLGRVPPAAIREVPPHLGQLMSQRGLGASPLFAVPETTTDEDGLLPESAVAPIRSWLAELAADGRRRSEVVRRTLGGAIDQIVHDGPLVARAVDDQVAAVLQLREDADRPYAEAVRRAAVQTADGTLLRGEVLERWHDFVGTGEFFRAFERRLGWLRDRVVAALTGRPRGADEVKVAVGSGLEALLLEEGAAAAERAEASWRAHPAGRALLARTDQVLHRPSPGYPSAVARTIRDWQGDVLDLVADEGMGRRSRARFLAFGINGVGVALMIVVFAQTGGLVGAEIGVAGGTAVLAQRVLEAVFGDEAVRRLARRAKELLDGDVEVLMSVELARFHQVLAAEQVEPGQAERIRRAVEEVQRCTSELGPAPAAGQQQALAGAERQVPAGQDRRALAAGDRPASDVAERPRAGADDERVQQPGDRPTGAAEPAVGPTPSVDDRERER